jgi:beta-lactamase regulating signal transducer with metallopeptidase domain
VLCILYVNAAGLCLGLAGYLIERALPATAPRRWVWCLVIPVSIVLPGFYRWHHAWAMGTSGQAISGSPGDALDIVSMTLFNPALWARIESFDPTINLLWNVASAFLLCWALVNAARVTWALHASRADRRKTGQPAIVDGVQVVVNDFIGPATAGFWRSRVFVPRWVLALPEAQRKYVLRHEEEHRAAHDARLLFVASLTLILVPWNLALWWQLRRLYLAVEMDCDNRVVNRLGNPNAYSELLLKVAEASNRGMRMQPALLGGAGSLEKRLTALLDPAPLKQVQRWLLPALAAGLLIIVLMTPHPVLRRGSHEHTTPTAVANSALPSPR